MVSPRARFKQLAWVIAVVLICATAMPWRASALDGSVRFAPQSVQITPGEEISIEVWMDDANGLYGLDLRISYDPSVVEILDDNTGIDGIQVSGGAFPYPDFEVKNEASAADSQVWYAVTQLNPREPITGSGIIMTMRIKALAEGTSYFDVSYGKFVNKDGISIDVATSNGEVQVISSAGGTVPAPPTRTHTATPTETATATPSITPTPTTEGFVGTQNTATAVPTDTPNPVATLTPSHTPAPTETLEPGQPTYTPQPTPTKTPYSAYPAPTTIPAEQPMATVVGTGGYPGPGATAPGQPTRSPLPTLTLTGGQPGSPAPTVYPGPGKTRVAPPGPTVPGGQPGADATRDPFAVPTGPAPVSPQAGEHAKVAMVMPTLEKVWPQEQPRQQEQDPLIPRETFICFSSGIVLVTLLLAVYLWRRDRIRARQA